MSKTFFICFLLLVYLFPVVLSQENSQIDPEYLPDIDGILKTKFEYDLENLKGRFEVRNARFGVKGKINDYISYRAELDLSDEGKMKMLDAFVKFTPLKNLDFYMGQKKIPFSTDYIRNPAENIFANRSFLAKYINEGMRDIGFYINYKLTGGIPIDMLIGAVNGTGNNNPQWIKRPNLAGRFAVGPEEGIRLTGNIYYGEAVNMAHLAMFGGEFRYTKGMFFIESEYISRNWTDTLSVRHHDDGIYIHSYYNFKIENHIFCLLAPTARVDLIGKSVLDNMTDASRLTLGLNAGLEPKLFYAEIRLNYENYFKGSLPNHTDKITLEFIARF